MADFVNRWAKNEWATGGKWANAAEYVGGKFGNKWLNNTNKWQGQPLRFDQQEGFQFENPTQKYIHFLKDAANQLRVLQFGRTLGNIWGVEDSEDRYDKEFWLEASHATSPYQVLVLRSSHVDKPGDAIIKIFENIENWSADCAMMLQFCLLYSTVLTIGLNKYNRRYSAKKVNSFRIQSHASTSLTTSFIFDRNSITQNFFDRVSNRLINIPPSDVINNAPIGSIFTITNLAAPETGTDFRNENAIKIGADSFVAHGYSNFVINEGFPPRNIFTLKELMTYLALINDSTVSTINPEEYLNRYLFIKQIQIINNHL